MKHKILKHISDLKKEANFILRISEKRIDYKMMLKFIEKVANIKLKKKRK